MQALDVETELLREKLSVARDLDHMVRIYEAEDHDCGAATRPAPTYSC